MTDPLLCPRIPLNTCDCTDYSTLDASISGVEEKLTILDEYIIRINDITQFKPATREFIRCFDAQQAIGIILDYCHTDNFFRRMTHSFFNTESIRHFSLPDAYFLLIELKCYINERRAAIIKNSCADTLLMIEQYQNHFSFNPPAMQKIEMNMRQQKFSRPDFFVPETILYIDKEIIFTVNDAICYVDCLIKNAQHSEENSRLPKRSDNCKATNDQTDLDILSFFENFRNLLFNNQNDIMFPGIIERACKYVYNISVPESGSSFAIPSHPCKYASFVETLAHTYKNNLSQKR